MSNVKAVILVCIFAPMTHSSAQTSAVSTAEAMAKSYGFTSDEFQNIKNGAVISKNLPERSDKELAGVVAIFLRKPVPELADILLEGKLLKSDQTIRALHVWKLNEPGDTALTGQPTELRDRYEAYRKNGLKGAGKPGEELMLAIKEPALAQRWPDFTKALLNFPSDQSAGVEHRFFFYQQNVENQTTFILSHRAGLRGEHAAVITEQRYYVGHTYDCRFIASDCIEMPGGTLMCYVNYLFTSQVAGVGSGLKHSIGRKRMLSDVVANLKRVREQLQQTADK